MVEDARPPIHVVVIKGSRTCGYVLGTGYVTNSIPVSTNESNTNREPKSVGSVPNKNNLLLGHTKANNSMDESGWVEFEKQKCSS
ncbi:hypothetical protein VNO77_03452 [Canavalia gladiata]|uniref:Uncharacterized protein n=1 Tax=Canavalia gladiata TaxID=3824 RepID=A0AAN9MUR8_CANGL